MAPIQPQTRQLKVTEEEGGSVLRLDYELAKTSFKRVRAWSVKRMRSFRRWLLNVVVWSGG